MRRFDSDPRLQSFRAASTSAVFAELGANEMSEPIKHDWQQIASKIANETDQDKVSELGKDLDKAIDEYRSKTFAPEDKSA